MESMFTYEMLEEMAAAYTTGDIIYTVTMNILAIVGYVLRSISLYTIAKRRGIANPWLAWVPVAWIWVLGSISDQFRYVTKAQVKNKRTTLLVMQIISVVASIAVIVVTIISAVKFFDFAMYAGEDELLHESLSFFFRMMGMAMLLLGYKLAQAIVIYIALYDVYMSLNPNNAVLFLVLSIFFGVTQPFFLFFNRKKDGGMPPRCDVPQAPVNYSYIPETVAQEPVATVEEPTEEENEEPVEEPAEEPAEEETEAPAEETEEPAEQTEVPAEETEEPAQQTEE